jgi:streptogramin lyase
VTDRDDFDRFLHDWLTEDATRRPPSGLMDDVSTAIRSRRPRSAWSAMLRGDGMDAPIRLGSWNPRPILLLGLLAALLVALAGGALIVGGLTRQPLTVIPSPSALTTSLSEFAQLPPSRPISAVGSVPIGESDGTARRFASDGTSLWVSANAGILRIDPATATVIGRVTPPATGSAFDFAVTPGSVWVVDADQASVTRYDAKSGRSIAVIRVPTVATWITSAAGAIWVGTLSEGTISRIDPATDKVVATVRVTDPHSSRPLAVAGEDSQVWIGLPPGGQVVRVDPASNTVAATVPVPALVGATGSTYLLISSGTLYALVNNSQGWSTVTAVDIASSSTLWTTRLDGLVSSPIVRPDALWIELLGAGSSPATASIVAMDPASGRVIDALGDASGPASDLTDALGSIWATRFGPQGRLDQFPSAALTVSAR